VKKFIGVFLLLVLSAALLGCGVNHKTTQAVAFISETSANSGNDYQIKTMRVDGSAVASVGAVGFYGYPFLSPNGKQVTYTDWTNNGQIGIMNLDGSKTTLAITGYDPQFTPDGTKIIYDTYTGTEEDVMLANADGTSPTNLTPNSGHNNYTPTVSPDSKTIAFACWGQGLCTLSISGGGMQVIAANNGGNFYKPTFSADGKTIFVTKYVDWANGGPGDIYSMDSSGTNLKQLTTDGYSENPIVAGNKILFNSCRDSTTHSWSDYEIYSMNPDGSNITRLTNNTVYDGFGSD
jgi:Tol biopolymer transport system component